jgi:hypothetical protein
MKECSWNVTPEDIRERLVRINPDGTMTVSLGINNEITLSKEHGKCEIRIDDTGSEVNVHVTVEDVRDKNGVEEKIMTSTSCRLKDFQFAFKPVSSYFTSGMSGLEIGMKVADRAAGALSTYNTYKSGYFKYNELWHQTKTRGVAWQFQDRWDNPGAKYWREQQIKPFEKARKTGKFGKFARKAGPVVLVADVAMSGELKWSHIINGGMVGISFTGWGSVVAAVWFVADFGTMGVNYIIGNGAKGLGDIIDEAAGEPIIEFYEGWY